MKHNSHGQSVQANGRLFSLFVHKALLISIVTDMKWQKRTFKRLCPRTIVNQPGMFTGANMQIAKLDMGRQPVWGKGKYWVNCSKRFLVNSAELSPLISLFSPSPHLSLSLSLSLSLCPSLSLPPLSPPHLSLFYHFLLQNLDSDRAQSGFCFCLGFSVDLLVSCTPQHIIRLPALAAADVDWPRPGHEQNMAQPICLLRYLTPNWQAARRRRQKTDNKRKPPPLKSSKTVKPY